MRIAIVAALALMLGSRATAQQCTLDTNGDKRTSIDELVTAIGEALNGCPGGPAPTATKKGTATKVPTKTPTEVPGDRCPYDFNDDTSGDDHPICGYDGTLATSCFGSGEALGAWSSDGRTVISILIDSSGSLGYVATKTNATSARITGVALGPDFDVVYPENGTMTLPSARAHNVTAGRSSECTDVSYRGTFTEIAGASAAEHAVLSGVVGSLGVRQPAREGVGEIMRRLWARRAGK
jgi:hypothetical protein